MENKFLDGYSASDLMTMASAKELPAMEEAYREKASEIKELRDQIRQAVAQGDKEKIASLGLLYRMGSEVLIRLRRDFNHAYECAKYVEEIIKPNRQGEGVDE